MLLDEIIIRTLWNSYSNLWFCFYYDSMVQRQRSQHSPKKIQDILQDIWKNRGHLTGLQKPISLHLLGIIVSRQNSKSSDVGGQ